MSAKRYNKERMKQSFSVNAAETKGASSNQIRVQIDLPYDFHHHNASSNHTPNSICLRIDFDKTMPISTNTSNRVVSSQHQIMTRSATKRMAKEHLADIDTMSVCSSTSGYSTSSLISSSSSADLKPVEDHDINDYMNLNHDESVENIYDKLTYTNLKNKSHQDSMAYSISCNNQTNVYEDIKNFCSKSSTYSSSSSSSSEDYENLDNYLSSNSSCYSARSSHIKRLNTSSTYSPASTATRGTKRYASTTVYKREYTLNEIFQNVKKFKEQAKELETTPSDKEDTLKSQEEDGSKSSVKLLKQMFEMKTTKSRSDKRKSITTRSSNAHNYENVPDQFILRPTFV